LALEIVNLHEVSIDDPEGADTSPGEHIGDAAAESAEADDRDGCGRNLILPPFANRGEDRLADIPPCVVNRGCGHGAIQWFCGESGCSTSGKRVSIWYSRLVRLAMARTTSGTGTPGSF
jgi:hypothetical protein